MDHYFNVSNVSGPKLDLYLLNPGIEPRSPTLQADSLPAEPQGKPKNTGVGSISLLQGIFQTQESNRAAFAKKKETSVYLSGSSLSAGLCLCTPKDTYADVLAKADKALYHVKQRGKSSYYFYTPSLNEAKKNSSDDLNRLITGLKDDGGYSGSLSVEYREFTKMFDFVRSIADRFSHNMELIMITVQPVVAGSLYIDEKEKAMTYMEKTIQASLRSVDVCTRFSSEQFLVILMDAEKEDIDDITNRIFDNFSKIYDGKPLALDYDVAEFAK